jgi:hypothetical protein
MSSRIRGLLGYFHSDSTMWAILHLGNIKDQWRYGVDSAKAEHLPCSVMEDMRPPLEKVGWPLSR